MTTRRPSLLRDLNEGVVDLHELARRDKVSRVQLARWACKPRHVTALEDLARLAERRTALLLATGRSEAALMLVNIARGEVTETREIVRKACLDLLKLEASQGSGAHSPAAVGGAPPVSGEPTEAEMRLATEALARYAEQREREDAATGAD